MATASATATIIQAAEHVVIEEATAVAKQLTTKNAAEIKSIVNGVAKETVAASDDSISTIIQNVEDGAKVIGGEIVKGAEAVVEAVEKHPELIAEGALALGIGVASIVQPELIVGSVALIGKMAADATKETINEIVVESGTGVVKGVSKEVTETAAELAAQDAAEKAKTAAIEVAKDGMKAGTDATVELKSAGTVTTEVVATGLKEGETAGAKVLTTVSGDATAVVREVTPGDAPGPIISSETVQTSATSTTEIKGDSVGETNVGPSVVLTTNDLTGDQSAAVQKDSTLAVIDKPAAAAESKPVAMASVDVKALAKEVAREMTELEASKEDQSGLKTVESAVVVETDSTASLKSAAARLEADLKESATKADAEQSKVAEADIQQGDKPKESEVTPSVPDIETKAHVSEDGPLLVNLGLVHPSTAVPKDENDIADAETNKVSTPAGKTSTTSETDDNSQDVTKTLSIENLETPESTTLEKDAHKAGVAEVVAAAGEGEVISSIDSVEQSPPKEAQPDTTTPELPKSAAADSIDASHHAVTHAAVLEAHEKIAKLHESNDLLHQKLDTMQEALLAITKALAERPLPAASAPEPIATADNQIVLASASATAPSTAAINKRMSVFGSIGWLFGAGGGSKKHQRGKSIATSTPASVPAGGMDTSVLDEV